MRNAVGYTCAIPCLTVRTEMDIVLVMNINREDAGFTLIELMVVVAVIGILMAIIMPTVGRVQQRGREVQCSSNLRQLHTGAMSYLNDHWNSELPRAYSYMRYRRGDSSGDGTTFRGWVSSVDSNGEADGSGHSWWYERSENLGTASVKNGAIFRYVGDKSVYVSPTHARLARRIMEGDRRNVVRSYGMNVRVHRRRLADIDGPSRTMLFANQGFENIGQGRQLLSGGDNGQTDSNVPGPDSSHWVNHQHYYRRYHTRVDGAIDAGRSDQVPGNRREWIGEYHGPNAGETGVNGGRANVVFVDGHIEQVPYVHTDYLATGNWEDGEPLGDL